MARYWLQSRPSGCIGFSDHLGSVDLEVCKNHGRFLMEDPNYKGAYAEVRVVERTDTKLWEYTREGGQS